MNKFKATLRIEDEINQANFNGIRVEEKEIIYDATSLDEASAVIDDLDPRRPMAPYFWLIEEIP